ncbi:MAG: glycosyltransferase family 2 protein [Flavobacteriaceae bacterium]|nr:glycosyltransferase family 2 protein [Flavobacteriaceae bacterium]
MTSSLVISTYNWSEALELVLKSVKNQSLLPDEVIIADDGSTDKTKKLIKKFQQNFPTKLIHFWHEDKGFRRSTVLNKVFSKTNVDYIIQLDGDCIIHKHFVRDHVYHAEKETFLYGSRVNIQESFLPTLFKNKVIHFNFFAKGIKKRTRNLCIPILSKQYKRKNELSDKLRGCNLSFWRKDIISVNGYNEDIEGWGREDSELIIRMLNKGVLGKRLRYCGILYHIYHSEKSKDRLELNDEIQQNSINKKLTWCENGIDKYLDKS